MTRERRSEGWAVDKIRMVNQIKPKHCKWTPEFTGAIDRDIYDRTVTDLYDHGVPTTSPSESLHGEIDIRLGPRHPLRLPRYLVPKEGIRSAGRVDMQRSIHVFGTTTHCRKMPPTWVDASGWSNWLPVRPLHI